jgi:hypothetical protein
MKCFVCGSEMRLDPIAGEESVSVSGFEHRSFRCSSCGDVEQRLVFRAERDADTASPAPSIQSSAIQSCLTDEQPAAFAAVRQPAKKVSGIYTRLKRLLPFRRESAVLSRSIAATPARDQQLRTSVECSATTPSIAPRSSHSAECGVAFIEADDSLDECEVLLKRAIDMVHGRHYSAETKTETDLKCEARIEGTLEIATLEPTVAPAIVVEPEIKPIVARELEPRPRKPVVVEIHYDPVKARFAAKDTRTGLLILRHEDRARLKGMCERMGWQVLDNEQQELECR